jgi:hypothetical protein
MDPIFWAIVFTLVIRKVFVDGAYAVRGETPPSTKLKMAKLKAAGGTGGSTAPSRYGAKDYLRDLWHDAIEDAREARVAKRAETKAAQPRPVGAPKPGTGTGTGPGGPTGPAPDPADQIPPVPCRGCGRPLQPHQINRGDDGEARCRTCHWATAPDPDDPRGQQSTGGQGTGGQGTDGQGGQGTDGNGSSGNGSSGSGSPDPDRSGSGQPRPDQSGRPEPSETGGTGTGQGRPGPDVVPCIGCGQPLNMADECDFSGVASLAKDARRRTDGAPICKACSHKPAITCAGCGTEVLPWGVWARGSDGADICGACHALEIGDHGFCLRPEGCGPDCPRRRPAYGWTCRCGATGGPYDTEAHAQAGLDQHAAGCTAHQNAEPDPAGPGPADGDTTTDSAPDPEPAAAAGPEADADDERPLAPVLPLFPTTSEEDTLTAPNTPSGEVTGLGSAKQYATDMAAAYANSASSVEQFTGSLAGFGVTGEAIAAADQAAEAQQSAASAWEACRVALEKQDIVADAYAATPEAGSKEFVTAE